MTKNSLAHQMQENFDRIKKIDVNANSKFAYQDTKDIRDAIDYWISRKLSLIRPEEQDQVNIVNAEIMRLESILLARTQFTMALFGTTDMTGVIADTDILSKRAPSHDKNFPSATGKSDTELPFQESTKEPVRWGQKTLETTLKDRFKNMKSGETSETITREMVIGKIIDFGDNKTTHIKDEETFNKYYDEYVTPLLLPEPKEAKVIDMLPETMKLSDLQARVKELLKADKRDEAYKLASKYLSVGKYKPDKKKQHPENWNEKRINSWLDDLSKVVKPEQPAATKTQESKEVETPTNEETEESKSTVLVEASYFKKLYNFFKHVKKIDPKVLWSNEVIKDLMDPEKSKKYGAVEISTTEPDQLLADLEKNGIKGTIISAEVATTNPFINDEVTLTEEVKCIESLIKQCKELRGDDQAKPTNMDKVEDLATLFFNSRPSVEYERKDQFVTIIKERPRSMNDAKDFFTMMCSKLEVYKEGDQTNLYKKIVDEVKAASKKKDFEDVYVVELVKKLKGKQLNGVTSDGKQEVVKTSFFTTFHVLHFIDMIVESSKGDATKTDKSGEAVNTDQTNASNVSTTQKDTASVKQTDQEKFDEALLLLVKNGGTLEDVTIHPTIVSIKGKEFADPNGAGKVTVNDDNFTKFVTDCFNAMVIKYRSTLTEYPIKDMLRLINIAYDNKVEVNKFVEENLSLLVTPNNKYLPLTGKLDGGKVTIPINNKEDFTKYVKSIYDLRDKMAENDKPEETPTYEYSTITSYKMLEDTIKKMVVEEKLSLTDVTNKVKELVADKMFKEEVNWTKPMFTSANPDVIESYVEALTRPLYITPESIAKDKQRLDEHLDAEIKKSEQPLLSFTNEVRLWCRANKIDFNLAEIRKEIVKKAETLNPTMYKKYMANLEASRGKTQEIQSVEPKLDKETVIDESNKETEDKASVIEKDLTHVKSRKDLEATLGKYKKPEYETAVLKAVKSVVYDKKQISDMKKMSEAEVNAFVTEFFKEKAEPEKSADTNSDAKEEKNKTVEVKTSAQTEYSKDLIGLPEFKNLSDASNKHSFKDALNAIIEKYKDSSDLRTAIIETINNGKGVHAVKVAKANKGNVEEYHKMIKKAFENHADSIAEKSTVQ